MQKKTPPQRPSPVVGGRRPAPARPARPVHRVRRARPGGHPGSPTGLIAVSAAFLAAVVIAFLYYTRPQAAPTDQGKDLREAAPSATVSHDVPKASAPVAAAHSAPAAPMAAPLAVPAAAPAGAPSGPAARVDPTRKDAPPAPRAPSVRIAPQVDTQREAALKDSHRVDELLASRDYPKAKAEAQALLARLDGLKREDLSHELAPRARDAVSLAALFDRLVAGAPSFADRRCRPAQGVEGIIHAATPEHLEVSVGAGVVVVPWAKAPAEDLASLFGRLDLSGEEAYALGVFCHDAALEDRAHASLQAAARLDRKLLPRVFDLVARWRGMSVPESGFVFHEKRWITEEELRYSLLDADVARAVARIRTGNDAEMRAGVKDVDSVLSSASLRDDFVERTKSARVAALQARRDGLVAQVHAAPAVVGLDRLKDLKRQLNAARAEALRAIRDTKVYPEEDHGRVGQPVIDEKVKAVRTLWETPLDQGRGITPTLSKAVDSIREIDSTLEWLSAPVAKGEDFQALLATLNRKVGIREFALDDQEKALIEHNRKVWAYNAKVQTSMSKDELEVVRLVNEYREMMGLRILECEDHLAQAARAHSKDMQARSFFAHQNPDGKQPWDRCFAAGYPKAAVGENIAMGYTSAKDAHQGWYNSSGHHRNMLGDYTQMGCGRQDGYWTEDFGGAAPVAK